MSDIDMRAREKIKELEERVAKLEAEAARPITGCESLLTAQISRIAGILSGGKHWRSKYIHGSDVQWLKEAIDKKREREGER